MRSGVTATATVVSLLLALSGGAAAQVPDLPPINEGPVDGSPLDPSYPAAPDLGAQPDSAPAQLPAPQALPAGPPIDVDRVMDRVKTCWTRIPQVYGTEAQGGVARIRIKFLADGTIDGAPMIIDKPIGPIGAKFAQSAAEAIRTCQPYRLPPERYAEWRQIEMRFDTIDPDNPLPPPPAPAPGQVPAQTLQALPPNDGYVPSVPPPAQ